jgi:hypothetical protein
VPVLDSLAGDLSEAEEVPGLADHLMGEAPSLSYQAMTLTSVPFTLVNSRSTMAARGSPTARVVACAAPVDVETRLAGARSPTPEVVARTVHTRHPGPSLLEFLQW